MKKAFVILSSGILLISGVSLVGCGGNSADTEAKKDTVAAAPVAPPNPDITAGLELIGKSDCLTCHKINDAATGPAYSLVAAKYAGVPNITDTLAAKIIKGGAGNWGAIPMSAHPNISVEDAKKMVTYVLSLKP